MALVIYGQTPEKLPVQSHHDKGSGYIGLRNQGATCYLNSVIQTLFMTPEFRTAIFSWTYDESKDGPKETCIPYQLQKLFGFLQLSDQDAADTVGLTTSFGWTSSDVFQQQDVQELFRVLFDALEEAFKETSLGNIIDTIYAGQLIDYIRCIDIDYQSERTDKFLDFSLAIVPFGKTKALPSLLKCIRMYLRPEILDGENQYYAEPVQAKVDAIKGIKFGKLPNIMAIQLKRFVFDFSGEQIVQKKLNDVVSFPMILDMNRYVSRRTSENGVSLDDFDEYVQEQIKSLRERKKQSKSNISFDETKEISTINASESSDDDPDEVEIPNLVDEFGCKSAEQLLEEERKREDLRFETVGASRQELHNLILTRGEWVYELYAVLIHSGAITGGHYYAFIKDLDTLKWYNFNDSHVTEIRESDVQDAWGKVITSTNYNYSWYSSVNNPMYPATTTLSGANAYMLMYRKVSPEAENVKRFPSDDMIPRYIREIVDNEKDEERRRREEEEERRKKITLSIYWKREMHHFYAKTTDTLANLLSILWNDLNMIDEDDFADIKESQGSLAPVPLDRIRLRNYSSISNMMLDVYEADKNGRTSSLSDLQIVSHRQYLVETRGVEDWAEYHPQGINVFSSVYISASDSFSEAVQLSIPLRCTVFELRQRLHKYYTSKNIISFPLENLRMFRASKTLHRPSVEIIANDHLSLYDCYHCFYTEKVYVEEYVPSKDDTVLITSDLHVGLSEEDLAKATPGYRRLYHSLHKIKLYYNNPVKSSLNHCNNSAVNILQADSRWTISRLREEIYQAIVSSPKSEPSSSVSKDRLRLFMSYTEGRELKSDLELRQEGIMNESKIIVVIGFVAPLHHSIMTFTLWVPLHGDGRRKSQFIRCLHEEPDEEVKDVNVAERVAKEGVNIHEKFTNGVFSIYSDKINKFINKDDDAESEDEEWKDEEPKEEVRRKVDAELVAKKGADSHEKFENNMFGTYLKKFVDKAYDAESEDEEWKDGVSGMQALSIKVTRGPNESASAATDVPFVLPEDASIHCGHYEVEEIEMNHEPSSMSSIEDIQPSDFAAVMISTDVDLSEIRRLSEIDFIFASDDTLVDTIRCQLAESLSPLLPSILPTFIWEALNLNPDCQISSSRLRIRECEDRTPKRILQNGSTFRQQGCITGGNRSWIVQILTEEEAEQDQKLPRLQDGDVLINMSFWHRSTWSLGERSEYILRGDSPVMTINRALARDFHVQPASDLLLLAIKPYNRIPLSELNQTLVRDLNRSWVSFASEKRKLKEYAMYNASLRHGDLLLLQDTKEPLKELTKEDRLSLQYVEEANRPSYVHYTGSNSYTAVTESTTKLTFKPPIIGSYGPSYGRSVGHESYDLRSSHRGGIKIKSKKDHEKQSTMDPLPLVAVVSPSESGEESPPPTKDDIEYIRSGGVALFDDMKDI